MEVICSLEQSIGGWVTVPAAAAEDHSAKSDTLMAQLTLGHALLGRQQLQRLAELLEADLAHPLQCAGGQRLCILFAARGTAACWSCTRL